MSTIGEAPTLVAKRTNESVSRDGLGVLRQALKQKAARLPDLDFEYLDAALTILRTALELKNYYVVTLLSQVDFTPARLSLLMLLFLCEQGLDSYADGKDQALSLSASLGPRASPGRSYGQASALLSFEYELPACAAS